MSREGLRTLGAAGTNLTWSMELRVNEAPKRLGHRPVLDGLRGIAVLLVMLTHTQILPNGYLGVDLFFGLSGFLITTLLYEEWERNGTISLRRFYGRRARRLLPALLILLVGLALIDVFAYTLTGWSFGRKTLTTLLFVNNWAAVSDHTRQLGALTPTWSLAEEEQFYLLWPLVLIVMLRHRLSPRLIVAILALAVVAALALSPRLSTAIPNFQIYFSPMDRGVELAMGCIAAIVWRSRLIPDPSRWRLLPPKPRSVLRFASGPTRVLVTWVAAALLAHLLLGPAIDPRQRHVYLEAALIGIPLMVMLLGAEHSLLAKLVAAAPLRYVGKISYALYLYHLPVRNLVMHYVPNGSTQLNALLTVIASVVAAGISWHLVESRLLKAHSRRAHVISRPRLVVVHRAATRRNSAVGQHAAAPAVSWQRQALDSGVG